MQCQEGSDAPRATTIAARAFAGLATIDGRKGNEGGGLVCRFGSQRQRSEVGETLPVLLPLSKLGGSALSDAPLLAIALGHLTSESLERR
jgi:hypothetical protein